MAHKLLMIGDSNIRRSLGSDEDASLKLGIPTTTISPKPGRNIQDILNHHSDEFTLIIISTLLNQVAAIATGEPNAEEIQDEDWSQMEREISFQANSIRSFANNFIGMVMIIPPILRVKPRWLYNKFDEIRDLYATQLGGTVKILDDFTINQNEELETDGVHLNSAALHRFYGYIEFSIRSIYLATNSIADEILTQPTPPTQPASTSAPSQQNRKRARTTDDETEVDEDGETEGLRKLREEMHLFAQKNEESRRFFQEAIQKSHKTLTEETKKTNIRVTANHRRINLLTSNAAANAESVDAIINGSRRNIQILRRTKIEGSFPKKYDERAKAITQLLKERINRLPKIATDIDIITVTPLGNPKNYTNNIGDVKVISSSRTTADEMRKRILEAKKQGLEEWKEAEVNNDPTKATRVRICILISLAKLLNASDAAHQYIVSKFQDAPKLLIKKGNKFIDQLTFTDAVIKHGNILTQGDIDKALKVAGPTEFKGKMESIFIVLKDNGAYNLPTPRPGDAKRAKFDIATSRTPNASRTPAPTVNFALTGGNTQPLNRRTNSRIGTPGSAPILKNPFSNPSPRPMDTQSDLDSEADLSTM